MNKEYIVKSTLSFNNIIKTGFCYRDKYCKIFKASNNLNHIRFGISVPKALGNAVLRNKIKRQIKEILRNNLNLYQNTNIDCIIIINNSFVLLSFNDKINVLLNALNKGVKK